MPETAFLRSRCLRTRSSMADSYTASGLRDSMSDTQRLKKPLQMLARRSKKPICTLRVQGQPTRRWWVRQADQRRPTKRVPCLFLLQCHPASGEGDRVWWWLLQPAAAQVVVASSGDVYATIGEALDA